MMSSFEFNAPQFVDFLHSSPPLVPGPGSETWGGMASPILHNDVFLPERRSTDAAVCHQAVKVICPINRTDSEKIFALPCMPKRLSRSDGAVNNIGKNLAHKKSLIPSGLRKRSFSESCIKTIKNTYPPTPNCLRRIKCTQTKKVKTTEEMELEKIAELRKQTYFHLRANEISMRKMGLHQKSSALSSARESKVKHLPRDFSVPAEKINQIGKTFRFPVFRPKSHAERVPFVKPAKEPSQSVRSVAMPRPHATGGTSAQNPPQPKFPQYARSVANPLSLLSKNRKSIANLNPAFKHPRNIVAQNPRSVANLLPHQNHKSVADLLPQQNHKSVANLLTHQRIVADVPPQQNRKSVANLLHPQQGPRSVANLLAKPTFPNRQSSVHQMKLKVWGEAKGGGQQKAGGSHNMRNITNLVPKTKVVSDLRSVANLLVQQVKSIPKDDLGENAASQFSAKKYNFHSGLPFNINPDKRTVVKPFNFHVKAKSYVDDMKPKGNKDLDLSSKERLSTSLQTPSETGKENVSYH